MNWLLNAHVFALAALLILGPGLLIGWSCRIRGLALWSAAGPLSVSFIAVAAVVLSLIGIRYTPVSLAGSLAFICALAWLLANIKLPNRVGIVTPEWSKPSAHSHAAWILVGLGLAFVIISWRLVSIFGSPDALSQTFDNVFHMNAIKFVLDSGSGSSLTIGLMLNPTQTISFYPSAWHDLAALISMATGCSIPLAANAANLVISALIWPAGIIFLVTRVTQIKPVTVVLSGILSAGFTAFPYLMLDFGVLYPYLLAVALLPFAVGLSITLIQNGKLWVRDNVPALLLLAASLPGLILAHPSSLLALTAFSFPLAVVILVRTVASIRKEQQTIKNLLQPVTLFIAYCAAATVGWKLLRPDPSAAVWGPTQSLSQSLGEGLLSAPMARPIPWIIVIMTICGIAVLARRRADWWILGVLLIGVGLFSMVSGMRPGGLRSFVTGGWYNDSYRLAALLPMSAIIVAVIGGTWIVEKALIWGQDRQRIFMFVPARFEAMLRPILPASAIVVFALLTQVGSVGHEVRSAAAQFQVTDESNLLSADELTLLRRIDQQVPAGATVVASPWTGASLVYALADRRTLTPHMFGDPGQDARYVLDHLDDISADPAVCDAVEKLHTFYVLDFGEREVHGGSNPFPGLKDLDSVPGITLIDSEGDARLFQITGCQ